MGATPQSSDIDQLVAGQTLVMFTNGTSFTFSFENAQLRVNTSFIPAYTDLKYGYSVVLLENEEVYFCNS